MAHMVNKANTRLLAANLISGHLAHAGNHRHGTAGHSYGWCSAQRVAVWAKAMAFGQGVVVRGGLPVLSCDAMWGNCDNCSYTHTDASAPECSPALGG